VVAKNMRELMHGNSPDSALQQDVEVIRKRHNRLNVEVDRVFAERGGLRRVVLVWTRVAMP
jgi:hypothetical protein